MPCYAVGIMPDAHSAVSTSAMLAIIVVILFCLFFIIVMNGQIRDYVRYIDNANYIEYGQRL